MFGCISVVVPEKGKTRSDYRTPDDYDYGEAFGFDEKEIEYAKMTAIYLPDYYEQMNNNSEVEVEKFRNCCETFLK